MRCETGKKIVTATGYIPQGLVNIKKQMSFDWGENTTGDKNVSKLMFDFLKFFFF